MMIGPIVTQMGPTLGGTNVSSVDGGGGGWEAAGAVFALALATEVAKASTTVVAAAVNWLRIRITEKIATRAPSLSLSYGTVGAGRRLVRRKLAGRDLVARS